MFQIVGSSDLALYHEASLTKNLFNLPIPSCLGICPEARKSARTPATRGAAIIEASDLVISPFFMTHRMKFQFWTEYWYR